MNTDFDSTSLGTHQLHRLIHHMDLVEDDRCQLTVLIDDGLAVHTLKNISITIGLLGRRECP